MADATPNRLPVIDGPGNLIAGRKAINANVIWRDTWNLLPAMLFRFPTLRIPLNATGVLDPSQNRMASPIHKPELEPLLSIFDGCELHMITVVSRIYCVAFVGYDPKRPKSRTLPVWYIMGNQSIAAMHSPSLIVDTLCGVLMFRDFMPEPFCRRIIYADSWDGGIMHGTIMSECGREIWTPESPYHMPAKDSRAISSREILRDILRKIRDRED